MKTCTPLPRAGFTLIELLTVVAIIGILATIIIPTVGKVRSNARNTLSLSNLRQIGLAINLYTTENRGLLPDDHSAENVVGATSQVMWQAALNPYVGRSRQTTGDASEFFTCPVYEAMLGKKPEQVYRGGYSMNRRMYYAEGQASNPADPSQGAWSSKRVPLNNFNNPSRTVIIAFGYWEGFIPDQQGNIPDERFSVSDTNLVPHSRRIGADSNGSGGNSGAYLMLDGSTRIMTPAEAALYLKLRT